MDAFVEFAKKIWATKVIRLILISVGIILCFLWFGLMQEEVTRGCWGGEIVNKTKCINNDPFEYELTFVGILTLWYAVVAGVILQFQSPDPLKTRQGWFAGAALAYIVSMVLANVALRTISYPTQVISKCAKPIPVLLIGVLLARKRYTIQKYFFVLMIVVGVTLFVYDEKKSKASGASSHIGIIIIGISLLADGVLGAIEDCMRATTKPSAINLMFSINMYCAIFATIGAVATAEVFGFYEFVSKHPDVIFKIASSAFVGAFGQVFIFMMVSDFGPLPCSIVTTTRKFFTVIISVIFKGNPITWEQQIATVIVFGALFADAFWGKKQLCGKPGAKPVPSEELDVESNNLEEKIPDEVDALNEKKSLERQ